MASRYTKLISAWPQKGEEQTQRGQQNAPEQAGQEPKPSRIEQNTNRVLWAVSFEAVSRLRLPETCSLLLPSPAFPWSEHIKAPALQWLSLISAVILVI